MENIKISVAVIEDLEQILTLLNEINESIKSKFGWCDYSTNALHENQEISYFNVLNSDGRVFVAKCGGRIVGLINMQIVTNIRHGWRRAHLEEVVVDKEFRRKGIGSKLILTVVDYCKENDIKVLKLMCGKQLSESLKFYEKNGFKSLDEGLRLELK